MCRNDRICPSLRTRQQGSSLVIAIFVMVVMSALAIILLSTLQQQDRNLNLDVNQTRALAAAESGIEWGLATVFNRGATTIDSACSSANSRTLNRASGFPNDAALAACSAEITCVHSAAAIEDDVQSRIIITATGRCGSGQYSANHKLEVLAYE